MSMKNRTMLVLDAKTLKIVKKEQTWHDVIRKFVKLEGDLVIMTIGINVWIYDAAKAEVIYKGKSKLNGLVERRHIIFAVVPSPSDESEYAVGIGCLQGVVDEKVKSGGI